MNVNLNKREEFLLKKIMQPLQNVCEPNSPVYYEMALKLIQNQLFGKGTLITTKGRQMLLSICEKIAFAQMDTEIENILAEAQEIELESTKVQSFNKTRNIGEKAQQVLVMLKMMPGSSRRELASALGWSINRVTPRIKELMEVGSVAVTGTKYDKQTDRNVEVLEAV